MQMASSTIPVAKPRLSEGWFSAIIVIAWVFAVISFLMYVIEMFLAGFQGPIVSETQLTVIARLVQLEDALSFIYPNFVVALCLWLLSYFVALGMMDRRDYWYRQVPTGTIVDFAYRSGLFGYQRYYVILRGLNRVGLTRERRHVVQAKDYYRLEVGQLY